MAKLKASPFKLNQVTVQKFAIQREPDEQGSVNITIHPSGYYHKTDRTFLLVLDVNITDSKESFNIDMSVFGHFEFKDIDSQEPLSNYFFTNAPALVFPYIRSYVSAVSALSGLDAIQLPVMNLSSLKKDLEKNITDIDENESLLN